ncbi:DUF2813 domain-containing protein [Succinatimonas hippei]|uniref:DUF2813 domain-containing protein n=1 Tax=Succinatimonas hippei TaxID=626938 RepID=UPI00255C8178|nr:DUF2813 domain-containing protein [Succinatimonas hippei]
MYLETAEIFNFRGIRHLKINFEEDSSVLIGENSWGKSSLLSALWMMLGTGEKLCQFEKSDLYIPIRLLVDNLIDTNEVQDKAIEASRNKRENTHQIKRRAPYSSEDDSLVAPDFQDELPFDLDQYPLNSESISYLNENLSFMEEDTFHDNADKLIVDLFFAENSLGKENKQCKELLQEACAYYPDGVYRIHWRAEAYTDENGKFITKHSLLNENLQCIECNQHTLIKKLIRLNPILRLRDGRMAFNLENKCEDENGDVKDLVKAFSMLSGESGTRADDIVKSISTLRAVTSKYLVNSNSHYLPDNREHPRSIKDMVNRPVTIESLNNLKRTLNQPGMNKTKLLISLLTGALLVANKDYQYDDAARPILIVEDIEGRFHPSLLLSLWSIIDSIPLQKIVTTNSSDLLTAAPLRVLRRLCKQYYDTRCYKVNERSYNAEDLRRIAFHIRINRPNTLFARCWILVEGETEIWLMTQIASLLGISLYCNGIRPVEFAQCGLHPLMKLARQLGISFFVLTDGDEAGKKYAQTVTSFVGGKSAKDHLTVLPHLDIEHYLYNNGYQDVFLRCSGISGPLRKGTSVDKIIELAIHKQSKPGLALAVMEEMQRRGSDGVPYLFKRIFKKISILSQNEYGID